jgi:hypothetical protein
MKEMPILFKPEMVKAILEGTKTQTRRIIQPQPKDIVYWNTDGFGNKYNYVGRYENETTQTISTKYSVGDILWVRETFGKDSDGYFFKVCDDGKIFYDDGSIKWKPSIHMPREAARLFLEVTSIKVEQLQDIGEADAIAEGLKHNCPSDCPPCGGTNCTDYIVAYHNLWDKINAKRGYSWESNPWVWVIEFRRIGK